MDCTIRTLLDCPFRELGELVAVPFWLLVCFLVGVAIAAADD